MLLTVPEIQAQPQKVAKNQAPSQFPTPLLTASAQQNLASLNGNNRNVQLAQATVATPGATQGGSSADSETMTPNEILALFQREARAAYQMNKEACDGLPEDDRKICLARARLQFDEDMRYAQKRANQGY
jgi:hypothetical protein